MPKKMPREISPTLMKLIFFNGAVTIIGGIMVLIMEWPW